MKDPVIENVRRSIADARTAHNALGVGFPKATVDCSVLERICTLAAAYVKMYYNGKIPDDFDVYD